MPTSVAVQAPHTDLLTYSTLTALSALPRWFGSRLRHLPVEGIALCHPTTSRYYANRNRGEITSYGDGYSSTPSRPKSALPGVRRFAPLALYFFQVLTIVRYSNALEYCRCIVD